VGGSYFCLNKKETGRELGQGGQRRGKEKNWTVVVEKKATDKEQREK